MRIHAFLPVLLAAPGLVISALGMAELRPDMVHVADSKKNLSYIRDGLVVGGDKAIDEVVVKDIRRAPNTGFERVVIDLEGSKNGESVAIQRAPYYQISVTPDERRLVFSLWGKPKLNFDSRKVLAAFKKSAIIQNIVLLPRIEENSWTFVFELKGESPVEVFELSNPVRIIMDIKRGAAVRAASHAPAKTQVKNSTKFDHATATAKIKAKVHEEADVDLLSPPPALEEHPAVEGHE